MTEADKHTVTIIRPEKPSGLVMEFGLPDGLEPQLQQTLNALGMMEEELTSDVLGAHGITWDALAQMDTKDRPVRIVRKPEISGDANVIRSEAVHALIAADGSWGVRFPVTVTRTLTPDEEGNTARALGVLIGHTVDLTPDELTQLKHLL